MSASLTQELQEAEALRREDPGRADAPMHHSAGRLRSSGNVRLQEGWGEPTQNLGARQGHGGHPIHPHRHVGSRDTQQPLCWGSVC